MRSTFRALENLIPSRVRALALLLLVGIALLGAAPASASSEGCTLDDMRRVSAAIAAWVTDQTSTSQTGLGGSPFDLGNYPSISHGDLEALLVPAYLDSLPATDAWGGFFDFRLNPDQMSPHLFAIRSLGADDSAEGDVYSPGFTSGPDDDLVIINGRVLRQPPPLPQRAQEFSVEQLRDVGVAMFSWLTDIVTLRAPREKSAGLAGSFDISLFSSVSHAELTTLLVPTYLPWVPELDGWGNPLEFYVDVLDPLGTETLAVRSAGSDGVVSGDLYTPGSFPFAQDTEDLVWADGVFIRFPEGGPIMVDGFESGDVCAWSSSLP